MYPLAAAVALTFITSSDPNEAELSQFFNLELARFPPANVTKAFLELNSKHYDWLDEQIALAPTRQLVQCREECSKCEDSWWSLEVIQDTSTSLGTRLKWMRKLRDELGEVAFAQGRMPPPVPVWRFSEGKPFPGMLPVRSRRYQTGVISNPPPP